MPNTTSYNFGTIVLVAFPFSNQTGHKQRPAIVVSTQAYHHAKPDLILLAVSSQVRSPLAFGERQITAWHQAGLLKASVIKPALFTLEQRLVRKTLGQLTPQDQQAVRTTLADILG